MSDADCGSHTSVLRHSSFVIRAFVIRHSSFVIPQFLTEHACQAPKPAEDSHPLKNGP
jgi:hypothetical protein